MTAHLEFEQDVFSERGFTLLVDGAAQSHVDRTDPTRLFFEYTRRIGHVFDAVGSPGAPITVLNLGGGALTLPRYVAATRPGSAQLVIEVDRELFEFVERRLPLPPDSGIDVRIGDAEDLVHDLGSRRFDVVVVDVYTRLDAPEFVEQP